MLKMFFDQIGMLFRYGREFVTRQVRNVITRVRMGLSLTNQAAKMTPKVLESMAAAGKKPTKRADYVETGRLLIAKSFIITLVIVLAVIGLIMYSWGWPLIQRQFMTIHLPQSDTKIPTYTGRVYEYYDDAKEHLMYYGMLKDGEKNGVGRTYYKNGSVQYSGDFIDDLYDGKGSLYDESTRRVYEGEFSKGIYNGQGTFYVNDAKAYTGGFADGKREGVGTEYDYSGVVVFQGTFSADERDGTGKEYASGRLLYNGAFTMGEYSGKGTLFDKSGDIVYQGDFERGKKNGSGTEFYSTTGNIKYQGGFSEDVYDGQGAIYDKQGVKLYEGGIRQGVYEGDGTLYLSDREWKEGSFSKGELVGDMKWYINGRLYYEGAALNGLPDGGGKLYNGRGQVVYNGAMRCGMIDGEGLLGLSADDIRAAFGQAVTSDIENSSSFAIVNSEAGVTVYCTYQTSDSPPTAYEAYVFADRLDAPDMLTKKNVKQLEEYYEYANDTTMESSIIKRKSSINGTPIVKGGVYERDNCELDGVSFYCYREEISGGIETLIWQTSGKKSGGAGGAGSEKSKSAKDSDDDLIQLLNKLQMLS